MSETNSKLLQNASIAIEAAKGPDLKAVLNLLTDCELPVEGLSEHFSTALVARSGHEIVGCAALELYGTSGLVRSIAVAKSHRGQGVGGGLVRTLLDVAASKGITRTYLLTETAGDYFPRFGFRTIDRKKVPLEVQRSVEFTSVCPVSALAMERRLNG